ncbi:MAG TPA: hypothetical protein VLT45_01280 [Kofleriaceae bacterium]|nr:hypothetical protein [Kofleriaceae bacterium]
MKSAALALALAACAAPPAAPAPDASPQPPAPIDVDACLAPDCPYVGAAAVAMRDDNIDETMLPVATNGIDVFGYVAYGATRATTDTTGAWTKLSDDGSYVHVRATTAGTGHFVVTAYAPYHDTEVFARDQVDLDVLPVSRVSLDLPRYIPLDAPIAPTVLGTDVTMAVRLLAADNRHLVDASLAITGAPQSAWNLFTSSAPTGHHEVTITADSLAAPTTLAFDTIDHIDEIRTTDTREPSPSYYHLVCAHAFAGGHEVFSQWKMSATNATGWIPADAGNCLEVVPGDTIAHVTFVAADSTTEQLDVAE